MQGEGTKPKVYIETTIVSYLTARPSTDIVSQARQKLTHDWWQTRRADFDIYISPTVVGEAEEGDPQAATLRLESLRGLTILGIYEDVWDLARTLVAQIPLPARAELDALHISIAVVHGMDYLLTWNCTHIANATLRPKIEAICKRIGYKTPIICTPEELLKGG